MKAVQYKTRFGRLKVEVNSEEVYIHDPGAGTPVLVITRDDDLREVTASIECAIGEGEVEHVRLTNQEIEWLEEQQAEAEKLLAPFWNAIRA